MNSRRALGIGLLSGAVLVAGPACRAFAEIEGPNQRDREVAKLVGKLMERGHITRHHVDDEISQRLFRGYLKLFDPLKLYFLQSDIEELTAQATHLDDDLNNGAQLAFAFDVYKRYLARLDERVTWAEELANAEYDFAKQESIVVDPDTATFAKTPEEAKEKWRVRIAYELASMVADGKPLAEARERIHKRYRNLKTRWHDLDNDELVEMYLSTLTTSFDPHSTYMSPTTLEDFEIHMRLSLEGIGALLQSEDGTTVVKEVVPGGAAEKDGRLKPGDQIVGAAEGENGEIVDLMEMKLRDVVKLIRGKAGTIVRLEVIPTGDSKRVVYNLTRQKIELKDQAARGEILDYVDPASGATRKLGYINLPSFYADQSEGDGLANLNNAGGAKTATSDVKRILDDFNAKNVDGVIMDLRANGGGLLTEAINLTGLFITEGPIVQVRDFDNRVQRYRDTDDAIAYDGPLVVLTSRFSASASEIFAGAIKDYGRGLVVGDSTTHGKGTVQKVLDLSRQVRARGGVLGAVKLTMQQFYRVNGQSTQNRGVIADIVLPSATDHDDFGEASLDYALEFSEIDPAEHESIGHVDSNLVRLLREASKARCETDPKLVELVTKKSKFDERKARKVLTFTEASLREEREQFKDEKGDQAKLSDDEEEPRFGKKDEKFGADAYSKEVLQILSDFIRLKGSTLASNGSGK